MGGIAGILGRLDAGLAEARARMVAALAPRGAADAAHTWDSPPDERGWGLVAAQRGGEPLAPRVGGVCALAGELDGGNLDALSVALAQRGTAAGARGAFALAWWDEGARRLLVARDPYGEQPLFWARNDDPWASWSFAFASSLGALIASGLLGRARLDPRAVASMVWNGFIVGPETAVAGAYSLPAGHERALDGRGRALFARDTWGLDRGSGEPRDAARAPEPAALAARFEARVAALVRPGTAVLLSGGAASAAIARWAQGAVGGPIDTLTVIVDGHAAAARGAHVLTEARIVEALDDALDDMDQPSTGALESYYLGRALRDHGYARALDGSGARALFGGTPAFARLAATERWRRRGGPVPRELWALAARAFTAPLRRTTGELAPQRGWARLPELVLHSDSLTAVYQRDRALFLPEQQRALLAPGLGATLQDGLTPDFRKRLDEEVDDRPASSAARVLELRVAVGEQALRDGVAAARALGVLRRAPLLDAELWPLVQALPDDRGSPFAPVDRAHGAPELGAALDRVARRALRDRLARALSDEAAVAGAGLMPAAVAALWRAYEAGDPAAEWAQIWPIFTLVWWSQRHGITR